jgi:MFS transporter, DHA1 family, staphyloferrin A biosynthesis exporter
MSFLRRIKTFESLQLRDFRFLWLGQITTSMGQWMDQFSRTWLIFQLTQSPMALGIVGAARGIPLLLFGVAAGVAADRWGRKPQLIIAQVVNAILNALLATLVLTGHVQVWHVYVTAFLAGTVQAFQQPARQALINDLVGQERLLNAVSLNSAALNLSRSVGPAVCGLLISAFGVGVSYYVQAAFYAAATLWTFQIRVPKQLVRAAFASTQQSFFSSAREGFAYIASHRLILALMVLGLAPILLGMPYQSLMPVFAIDVLHGGATTQGLLVGSMGVGAVLGGLIIASLGRRQGNGKLLIVGAAGFGLSLILFSRAPVVWAAACFTFLVGLSNSAYTSQDQTIIQTITEPKVRGRVLGVYLLNRGLMPIGSLLAGALATWFGGPWAVTIMGVSCLMLAVGVAVAVPALWKTRLIPDIPVEGRPLEAPLKS